MAERNLTIISEYLSSLKEDPVFTNASNEIETALKSIESLKNISSEQASPSLSITLPRPDSMRCTICSKTVVKS